tara:strand:+ start:611 stop:784 length:174 start_codon:yes stop_codon:yes gene_type:complete
MKTPIRVDWDAARRQIIEQIDGNADWDDLLRIYQAAVDPDAELSDRTGEYQIYITIK